MNTNKSFIAVVHFNANGKHLGVSKTYDFHCSIPVSIGDLVVVYTVEGMQLARVHSLKEVSKHVRDHAWVISRVDETDHKIRMECRARKTQVTSQIEQRIVALRNSSNLQLRAHLCSVDPEFAKLVSAEAELAEALDGCKTLPGYGEGGVCK